MSPGDVSTDGEHVFVNLAGLSGGNRAGVTTVLAADLANDSILVELVDPALVSGTEAFAEFVTFNGLTFTIQQNATSTSARWFDQFGNGGSGTISYSPEADRWWSISHDASLVTFQAGRTPGAGTAVGFGIAADNLVGVLSLGASTSVDQPVETVAFDNLNTDRTKAPWCRASTLADAFDSGPVSSRWRIEHGTNVCTLFIPPLSASATFDGTVDTCALRAVSGYSLVDDTIFIDVSTTPALGAIAGIFIWNGPYAVWFGKTRANGADHLSVRAVGFVDPTDGVDGPYSRLRISHTSVDNKMHFSGWSDARNEWVDYSELALGTSDWSEVSVSIGLRGDALTWPSNSVHASVSFDNYNLAH